MPSSVPLTSGVKELTPELVHEFIEKIVVHAPKYLDGKRYQLIDIYFYGVGIVKKLEPEEMESEVQECEGQDRPTDLKAEKP